MLYNCSMVVKHGISKKKRGILASENPLMALISSNGFYTSSYDSHLRQICEQQKAGMADFLDGVCHLYNFD